jgi:LAO/AO transport system kinase
MIDAGVHQVFHTGTTMLDIVKSVSDSVKPYETTPTGSARQHTLARAISLCCEGQATEQSKKRPTRIIGLTGSPGAGKSTLVASMASELHDQGEQLAVIAFDPMSPITSGALFGDRLRVDFNKVDESVFYRSLAVIGEDYQHLPEILNLLGGAGYNNVIVETVGSGQSDVAIRDHVDTTVVVVVPGMGDAVQMDKAGILEIADTFVVNKADFEGEARLVRELLDISTGRPIYETIATRGQGITELVDHLFPVAS